MKNQLKFGHMKLPICSNEQVVIFKKKYFVHTNEQYIDDNRIFRINYYVLYKINTTLITLNLIYGE